MSYTSFWRTLRRILLVAGFATLARIYAFRVGALMMFDGSLTPAIRNFVASHTTYVMENNYQTERIRDDLAPTRFRVCASVASNEPLLKAMRDLSKQHDPGPHRSNTGRQPALSGRERDQGVLDTRDFGLGLLRRAAGGKKAHTSKEAEEGASSLPLQAETQPSIVFHVRYRNRALQPTPRPGRRLSKC